MAPDRGTQGHSAVIGKLASASPPWGPAAVHFLRLVSECDLDLDLDLS